MIERPGVQRVEVPLTFDAEFFDILHGDVATLDSLQAQEQKVLTDEIAALSKDIATLARYARFDYLILLQHTSYCRRHSIEAMMSDDLIQQSQMFVIDFTV